MSLNKISFRSLEELEDSKILIQKYKDKIKKLEKEGMDVFVPHTRASLLASKIHFFNATFNKKDFKSIMLLFILFLKSSTNSLLIILITKLSTKSKPFIPCISR